MRSKQEENELSFFQEQFDQFLQSDSFNLSSLDGIICFTPDTTTEGNPIVSFLTYYSLPRRHLLIFLLFQVGCVVKE
jgi:hypothetical protein